MAHLESVRRVRNSSLEGTSFGRRVWGCVVFLDNLKQILGVVSPLAVAVGVIIALLQLRNQHRLRQIDTVMRLYSSFGQDPFVRHFKRVTDWTFETYEAYLEKGTEEDYISLTVVTVFFEGMGLLLKRKLAPIDLLDDLLSGPIILRVAEGPASLAWLPCTLRRACCR